jgi:OOP family OmpA-OmpF porin
MKQAVIALVLVAASQAAVAADRYYVEGSLGRAEQELNVEGFKLTDKNTGGKIAAGMKLAPNFAVEAGYAVFGTGEVRSGLLRATAKPRSLYLAGVGSVQLAPNVALEGKVGVVNTRTKAFVTDGVDSESQKERETSVLLGAGVSYAFSQQVSLLASYEHFGKVLKEDGGDLKADLLSVGVRFKF